ncbi:hypothetical protein ACFLWW_03705, partial [Chloroflexota bacterium]
MYSLPISYSIQEATSSIAQDQVSNGAFLPGTFSNTERKRVTAITLTFDLPEGIDATTTDLVIAMWDGDEWILLGGTVNTETNTIEVAVDHFTPFAV